MPRATSALCPRFGTPENDSPINGLAKVESKTFDEASVMDLRWSGCKLGKSGNGIVYVRACCNIWIRDFAEEHVVGKSHIFGECSMFGAAFKGASGLIHGMYVGGREWFGRM
jgi:hypothetical protein